MPNIIIPSNLMTFLSIIMYRSFGGEVKASNTPHDTPPYPFMPSPTSARSSIAPHLLDHAADEFTFDVFAIGASEGKSSPNPASSRLAFIGFLTSLLSGSSRRTATRLQKAIKNATFQQIYEEADANFSPKGSKPKFTKYNDMRRLEKLANSDCFSSHLLKQFPSYRNFEKYVLAKSAFAKSDHHCSDRC